MLFPPFCIGCGQPGSHICKECSRAQLIASNPECFICRNFSPGYYTHPACRSKAVIRRTVICWRYDAFAKKLMGAIKEQYRYALIKPLAELAVQALSSPEHRAQTPIAHQPTFLSPQKFLVPVPSPRSRLSHRGFSHTALLAKGLSQITGAQVYPILSCTGDIRQTGKNRQERMQIDRSKYRVLPSPHVILHDKNPPENISSKVFHPNSVTKNPHRIFDMPLVLI
ncbi:MAG: hypothetical protein PHG63_03350, partial [Candidatus Dojkabacteria bacterium]|nr:hypothetical protein [Candidatus Dojkabacteria bacterium]